jgi:radical SAM protein with 4Fe4S-binding SPASM domain
MRVEFSDAPRHLAIELHSHCNRDCFFCPRFGDRSGRRKDADGKPIIQQMSTERVHDLLRQAKEMGYTGMINFHHLSEPFLDKRLLDFARAARSLGFECLIHTNGDVLRRNYKMSREAAKLFSSITVGLYDYRNVFELIRELVWWRIRLWGTKLNFTLHQNVFPRHNVDEKHPAMKGLQRQVEAARKTRCGMVREHLIIHYDGTIGLCCEDYTDIFKIGNAFETPLKDLWWSARRREVLDILDKPGGRLQFSECSSCPYSETIMEWERPGATWLTTQAKRVYHRIKRAMRKTTSPVIVP